MGCSWAECENKRIDKEAGDELEGERERDGDNKSGETVDTIYAEAGIQKENK